MMVRLLDAGRWALFALMCLCANTPGTVWAQTSAGLAANFRIAGTVVNAATGAPIQGATVALLGIDDSHRIAATQSGNDGRFAIDGLAAGKYQLTASKRGYSTAAYEEHGLFSSAVVTGAGVDSSDIVFKLTPGAVLRGVVTADGGDAVMGARVMLFAKLTDLEPGAKITQVDTSISDDTGAYEFSNVSKGTYLVAVQAEPWYAMHVGGRQRNAANSALDVAYPVTFFDSTTEEAAASPIVLTGGSRVEANINLHAVPALRIVVEAPRKQDGSVAMPQLRQTIFGTDISLMSTGFQDSTRAGGREFTGVAPGQYEVTQGDPPRVVELDATTSQQVEAGAGIPAFTVSGTIESATGEPVTGYTMVTLEPADNGQGLKPQVAEFDHGRFSLAALPAGRWRVQVQQGGLGVPVISVVVGGRVQAGNTVTLRDRGLRVVVRAALGGMRVEGFARRDGKGVAGVMVLLVPSEPAAFPELVRRDQSDSDGSFAIRDVPPGAYTAVAIENAWGGANPLEWTRADVMARYLPGGVAVTVTDSPKRVVRLAGPVPVQMR